MATIWTVERNTGSRAYLIFESLRKAVWRPQTMSRMQFFALLAPGRHVDEGTLRDMFKVSP